MLRRRTLVVLTVFLLTLAGLTLLRRQSSDDAVVDASSPLAQDFDYFIADMVLDRFGPDGTRLYHLTSQRVTHYPVPGYSVLESPSLRWMEPEKPDWILTARDGDLRTDPANGATRLLLEHDVVASRKPADGATLHIRSESLLVLPEAGEASTELAVSIESANTNLQAAGMHAWLRDNRVRLSAGSGQHE